MSSITICDYRYDGLFIDSLVKENDLLKTDIKNLMDSYYTEMILGELSVKSIKELNEEVNKKDEEVEELKAEIDRLKSNVDMYKNGLNISLLNNHNMEKEILKLKIENQIELARRRKDEVV